VVAAVKLLVAAVKLLWAIHTWWCVGVAVCVGGCCQAALSYPHLVVCWFDCVVAAVKLLGAAARVLWAIHT
jgi:hypothetical protein